MKAFIVTVGCILLIAFGAVLYRFGTLSPCGIVREQVREEGVRQGDFAGALASLVPDSVLDAMITAAGGLPTPGRCLALLLNGSQTPPAPAQPQQTLARSTAQTQRVRVRVLGIGAGSSCGTWSAIQKDGGIPQFQIRAWTQGYLSSAALRQTGADPLANLDAPGIFAWLDQYCAAHPTAEFSAALDAFLAERR